MKLRFSVFFLALPLLALAADPGATAGGLDTAAMNKSVDPCVDFYQYACGSWMARNPIPADRARFGRFTELQERNEKVLLDILQGAAAERSGRSALDQKIGDAYAACMDTAAIEKRGLAPIKPELDRIAAIAAGDNSLLEEIVRLQADGVPVVMMFNAQPDAKDSTKTIATLGQGGLSLPDRDFYLKTDPKSNKRYHIMTKAELSDLTGPSVDWAAYFKLSGAPAFETLNVTNPEFFKTLAANRPGGIDQWKAYLAYHLLRARATELPAAFEKENFNFWQSYLTGAHEQRPRSMRCVQMVDRGLGDLLGQKYIQVAFGNDAKTQITQLVENLEKAMGQDIRNLPWMTEETKKAALAKLAAITNNVAVPKKWRDYSKIAVGRDDFYGNVERISKFQRARDLEKIGTVTDKSEWMMTPPTVNAFYSPQYNSINFPAGILQSPFFDPRRDMAVNYGGVGAVIGHEMTHGFDDQGRKFDGSGNLRDWWTAVDAAEFEKRAACVANEYSGFTAGDVNVNGRLTLGENTADNGGIRIAYLAMENALNGKKEKLDGFTPEQRFFLGYAQIWCENATPQSDRQQALTNPHSPGRYRVSGVVQNMPEFQQAFSCKAGQPMVSTNACRVW
jgi:endothelin-converting enzyme/putative endopeptidase